MDDGQDPSARASSRSALIAWAVIALCVGAALWSAFARPGAAAAPARGGFSPFEFQLRAAIGAYQVLPEVAHSMLAPLDADQPGSHERLQLAIAAGEVAGPTEARRRLDALAGAAEVEDDRLVLGDLYADGPAALSDEARARVRARLGWSGELALVHGLPAEDPARRAVLGQAWSTMVRLALVNLLGLVLLVGGVVSLVVLGLRWRGGRLQAAYPTPLLVAVRHRSACLEGFALYLVSYLVFSNLAPLLAPGWGISSAWLYLPLVPVVLLATVRRGMPWRDLRQAIGWHAGRGFAREIGAGIVGWLAALPLIALALVAAQVLSQRFPASHPIEQVLTGADATTLWLMLALASGFAPVVEELMFRGLLFHHLRTRWAWLPAALLTSGIFAALHPQGVAALPALATIAMVMAALRAWRGSLIAPIAAHALNNAVVLAAFVLIQG